MTKLIKVTQLRGGLDEEKDYMCSITPAHVVCSNNTRRSNGNPRDHIDYKEWRTTLVEFANGGAWLVAESVNALVKRIDGGE